LKWFFQDSRRPREPFFKAPAAVMWLIFALLATHVARTLAPLPWSDFLLEHFAFIPARYSASAAQVSGLPPPNILEQVLDFVSYMFLHGGFMHVVINSLWLLAFGPIVARRLGPARFLVFFLFCGALAAATHLAVYWGVAEEVVGASGGVCGLMAAGIRILYGHIYSARDPATETRPPLAPMLFPPIIGFTIMWVLLNVIAGITGLGLTDDSTVIAWVAHLGGYFAGFFAINVFDRISVGERSPVGDER